jgi:hypothetical protein
MKMARVWMIGFVVVGLGQATSIPSQPADERGLKLKTFFESYRCPAPYHIQDYLREADKNSIDYRLLPAISVRESTCGRHARLNNHWGWDSARTGFASVREGIRNVARALALGKNYRDKSIDGKLKTYNPNPRYAAQVLRLMGEIDE